jgi:hypothetical protein
VLLLHGFPYDIHSFVDVAPMLGAAGYRVIVPHLRGHGTTRFLSNATFRNGQQAAVVLDTIALMDALKIDQAILAGSVLLCHGPREGRARSKPTRAGKANLEVQFAEVGLRRRHVRP